MKILVQWTTRTANDWQEINAADWANTPAKQDPTGLGLTEDDSAGWVHAICIQGVTFNGYDHYSIEQLTDGSCEVICWSDDPNTAPDRTASEWLFLPMQPNQYGAWDTHQIVTRYAEGDTLTRLQQLGVVKSSGGEVDNLEWREFQKPESQNIRHGKQVSDEHNETLDKERSAVRGDGDPWLEGVPEAEIVVNRDGKRVLRDQAELGRRILPDGTRTWFLTNATESQTVHTLASGNDSGSYDATETGDDLGDATLLSRNHAAGDDFLCFSWYTPSGEPGVATWPSGTYVGQFRITATGNELSYGWRVADSVTGHLGRVNSALSSEVDTITQTQALFAGVATHTGSSSWTPSGSTTSDRLEMLLASTRITGNHGNQTYTVAVNETASFIEGPFTADDESSSSSSSSTPTSTSSLSSSSSSSSSTPTSTSSLSSSSSSSSSTPTSTSSLSSSSSSSSSTPTSTSSLSSSSSSSSSTPTSTSSQSSSSSSSSSTPTSTSSLSSSSSSSSSTPTSTSSTPTSTSSPGATGKIARRSRKLRYPNLWRGLVGAWSPSESPPGGSVLRDQTGYHNDGTLTSMDPSTDYTIGEKGRQLDMVATSSQFVDCGDIVLMNGLTYATLSFWGVRPDSTKLLNAGFERNPGSDRNLFHILHFTDGNVFFSVGNGELDNSFPFVALATDSNYHLYTIVFDGTLTGFARISGYIDGDEKTLTDGGNSPASTLSTDMGEFLIGRTTARFTTGSHSEALLYDRALTANEVRQLFKIGPGGIFKRVSKTICVPTAVDENSSSSSSSTPTSTSSLSSSSSTPTSTSSLSSSSSSSSTPTSTSSLSSSSSSSSTPTSTSSQSSSSSSSSTPTSTSSLSSSSSSSSTPTSTSSLSSSSSSSSTPTSTSSQSSSSSSSSTPTSTSSLSSSSSSSSTPTSTSSLSSSSSSSSTPTSTSSQSDESSSSSTPTSTSSLSSSSSSSSTPTSTSSLSSQSSSSSTPTSTSSQSSSSSSSSTPTSTSSLSSQSSSSSTPTSTSSLSSSSSQSEVDTSSSSSSTPTSTSSLSSSSSTGRVPINPREGCIEDIAFDGCITPVGPSNAVITERGPQSGTIGLT